MVVISLDGRFGNQLFQYAFCICLGKKLKKNYLIDDNNTKDDVRKYFQTLSLTDYKFVRNFILLSNKIKQIKIIQQSVTESNTLLINSITNNVYYKGSFQSSDFFLGYDLLLKTKFKIKLKYRNEFQNKFGNVIKNKTLAIHYRIGDYKIFGGKETGGINLCLPDIYYQNALNLIKNKNDYEIIIVTDDIEAAKHKLPEIKNKTIISDSEINDFQLLMHADILIISNSTFAWWGAYLNHKNAKVFAPEYWLGFKIKKEFPFNIIPDNFIKVSFDC